MNKQIEKLAYECYEYWEPNCNGETSRFDYEKFAKLIAAQCAIICRNQPDEYALPLDRENCAGAIEEYFGVE